MSVDGYLLLDAGNWRLCRDHTGEFDQGAYPCKSDRIPGVPDANGRRGFASSRLLGQPITSEG